MITLLFLSIDDEEDDKQFITNLYLEYYPLLKKQAYSITSDVEVVDDLIHDAFIKLIPKISLLRSLSRYKVTSYIVYTVRNVCIDYMRKKKRISQKTFIGSSDDITQKIPDLQAATEENLIKNEEFDNVSQILLQLSERDRRLLYYKYNMEMKDREIAALLDIPVDHVRKYIARARQRAFLKLSQGAENSDKTK